MSDLYSDARAVSRERSFLEAAAQSLQKLMARFLILYLPMSHQFSREWKEDFLACQEAQNESDQSHL